VAGVSWQSNAPNRPSTIASLDIRTPGSRPAFSTSFSPNMRTVATANFEVDADSAGIQHVDTGLPSFEDAGPVPPELQSSCPTPLPRPYEKAVHKLKRREAIGKRCNSWYARPQHPMLGVRRDAHQMRYLHLEGVVGQHTKQSAYEEEPEISSDDDHIKRQMQKSPRTLSGNIRKADKLCQASLRKKGTYRSRPSNQLSRAVLHKEPELKPDVNCHVRGSATQALSTPPPTP
jgi:hypothetical protein